MHGITCRMARAWEARKDASPSRLSGFRPRSADECVLQVLRTVPPSLSQTKTNGTASSNSVAVLSFKAPQGEVLQACLL